MSVVPIRQSANTAADRDIARCSTIANLATALDTTADTITNAANLIERVLAMDGLTAAAAPMLIAARAVAEHAKRIADNARSTIA